MSTLSVKATAERSGTLRGRLSAVPWLTVVPLAVVLAFADGFWVISLRGAVGSIERTQQPFTTWLAQSTLALPVFVLAVLGALTLGARWFGPVLDKSKTVVATALLVAAAGTLVGGAALAASSAYDYQLQSSHVNTMMASMASMGQTGAAAPAPQNAGLGLQVRAVGYGSGILLATNLVLVGWMVAMRGGRLTVSKTRH
jgi:hypothetical protein